jgi:hypothetical protein
MVPTCCPEMSVRNYHYKLHNIPKSADLIYFIVEAWNHSFSIKITHSLLIQRKGFILILGEKESLETTLTGFMLKKITRHETELQKNNLNSQRKITTPLSTWHHKAFTLTLWELIENNETLKIPALGITIFHLDSWASFHQHTAKSAHCQTPTRTYVLFLGTQKYKIADLRKCYKNHSPNVLQIFYNCARLTL